MDIRETELMGIGKKYRIHSSYGEEVVIVLHDDGRRELYAHDPHDNDMNCVLTLNDAEARQLSGIMGGLDYKPKALETIEVELEDLTIEWYKVPADSPACGKTIGELEVRQKTGAVIIAAVKEGETAINPGPDFVVASGSTLVVAGKRSHIKMLKDLLIKK